MLATTLADPGRYSRKDLSELYHGHWSIEELHKISKDVIKVEAFHGRSERGVRQELYARFNLIAMARLFSNRGDGALDDAHEGGLPRMRTNFSNALAMPAGGLKELILAQAAAMAGAVGAMSGNAAPKAASALASALSVFASSPPAFAKSRGWRGLTAQTVKPRSCRDCRRARCIRPVASRTTRSAPPSLRMRATLRKPSVSLAAVSSCR